MIQNRAQFEHPQISAISRLFSPSVFKELANRGKSQLFAKLLSESLLLTHLKNNVTVSDIFESAFSYLKEKKNRHEYIYKAAITHKVLLGRHSLSSASMITEFRALNSKADVVIVNGTTTAYEIKSERDNLDRLEAQISDYMKVFGKVNIITGENHISDALKLIPDNVGAMVLNDRYQISTIREATEDLDHLDVAAIFESLQLREIVKILNLHDVQVPDVANTLLYRELKPIFAQLSIEQVHSGMVTVLKETRSLFSLNEFVQKLPPSLHSSALTTKIRRCDQKRVIESMQVPAKKAILWN